MKIAFLHKYPFAYTGIISLHSVLSPRYERTVFIGDLEKDVVGSIIGYRPDILGLSMMSTEYSWMKEIVPEIRKLLPSLKVMTGGVHATICPEIIEEEFIDAVCIGEAERSLPEFLTRLVFKQEMEPVAGFWVKKGGEVLKSRQNALCPDLDELPDEDRSIYYDRYPVLREEKMKHFMASRGCPFSCSFCCHHVYKRIFRGKDNYIRWKSPEKLVREIKNAINLNKATSVYFMDDVFVLNIEWLRDFAELYRDEINLPFYGSIIPALFNQETAHLLKKSGCRTVTFGVETGNESKRRGILNKPVSNKAIIEAARLIKAEGMKIQTTNLFGLPLETVDEAFETILFNIKIKTDYLCSNILTPFPKTVIEEKALSLGILEKDYILQPEFSGTHLHSLFHFKDISVIENVSKIAHLALKMPVLLPFFRQLVRLKSKKLFFLLFVVSTTWRYKSENKLTWSEVIKVVWRHRKNYL